MKRAEYISPSGKIFKMQATYEDLERLGSLLPDVDYNKMVSVHGTSVFDVLRAFYQEAKNQIFRQLRQTETIVTKGTTSYKFTLGPDNGQIKAEYKDENNQWVSLEGEEAADLLDTLHRPARV